jgi:DDE superfamily endonuclease
LELVFGRVAGRFGRADLRWRMRDYVRGLLGQAARKNGWQLAEWAGHRTPDGFQRLLNSSTWDADALRDDVRAYVAERLGPDGVLIIDDTGFIKKGTTSAGVGRQYTGTFGKIDNCQIGVFAAYATSSGRALVDRELYLPKAWASDRQRCRAAKIPEERGFATKGDRPGPGGCLAAALLRGRRQRPSPLRLGERETARDRLVRRRGAHPSPLGPGPPQPHPPRRDRLPSPTPPRPAPSQTWRGSRAAAGRSRSVSRRRRTSAAWTSTRSAATSAGTGTSPWPCSPTPSWPHSPPRPPATPQRGPQKRITPRPTHRGRDPAAPGRFPAPPTSRSRPLHPHPELVVLETTP